VSCYDRARDTALECANKLEATANSMAIMRSVDATESAKWLREMAHAIRSACELEDSDRKEPAHAR
jgi:hypothetical protein